MRRVRASHAGNSSFITGTEGVFRIGGVAKYTDTAGGSAPLTPPHPTAKTEDRVRGWGIGEGGAGGAGRRGGARGVSPPGIFCNRSIQDDGRVSEYGLVGGDDMIHISWVPSVRRSQRVRDHSLDTGVRKYNTV